MKEKKERKKWGLIFFIVIIMMGTTVSFVFFGFSPVSERIKYNGISFVNNGNIWLAKINGRQAAFSFQPNEAEKVAADDFAKLLQNKVEIDMTYDFNSTFAQPIALAQHQMGLTLEMYNIYLRKGFTTNNSFNLSVITCNNATENVPVIYFRHANSTNIRVEGNCIIAEAPANADFILVKDRLLYGMLGVIK